jgi:hypothetical protein
LTKSRAGGLALGRPLTRPSLSLEILFLPILGGLL